MKIFFFILGLAMISCAGTKQIRSSLDKDNANLYSYELLDSQSKKTIGFKDLLSKIKNSDVIFFGEFHGHPALHLLEAEILSALNNENSGKLALSLEQFTRNHQSVLDQYLASKIGEVPLKKEARAWNNYNDYRPLVEFAKERKMPVIAANGKKELIRCVAKSGKEFISRLSDDNAAFISAKGEYKMPFYEKRFHKAHVMSHGAHGKKNMNPMMRRMIDAQIARDATMAESIDNYLKQNPEHKVFHINGAFHSDYRMGAVFQLEKLNPDLKITVLSPYVPRSFKEEFPKKPAGDFLVKVLPMPPRFVDKDRQKKHDFKLFSRIKPIDCKIFEKKQSPES